MPLILTHAVSGSNNTLLNAIFFQSESSVPHYFDCEDELYYILSGSNEVMSTEQTTVHKHTHTHKRAHTQTQGRFLT